MMGTDIISYLRRKYIIRQRRISYRASDISLKIATIYGIIQLDKLEFDEVRQMTIQTVEQNNILCAVINSDEKVFTDAQSALDVLMTAKYNVGTKNIIIDKKLIVEDFFILSTGLAGEILQKYTNYGGRIAIYGDYSRYTSKPLRDFIYESNKGKSVFFVATKEEAIEMLTK